MIKGVNKYQTPWNSEIFSRISKETLAELQDLIEDIPFVQRLLAVDRKFAKDLDRDKFGRIVVDITNPHILEDMDYFRPAAIHYQKHGVYTLLTPNKATGSEYQRFWAEQTKRCIEGYVRESDGEWIPGYYYFYLNFSPIELTKHMDEKMQSDDSTNIRADREVDFPLVWDGDYLYFHYIEQAERKGLHANVLKTRGRGFSFKGASMGARNYSRIRKSKSYMIANEKEYLTKDGTMTKTWDILDFLANNTPWPRLRLIDQPTHKKLGYKDPETNSEQGRKSEIIGVTTLNNPNRARGKRGKLLLFEESGVYPKLKQVWRVALPSVSQGNVVYGLMVSQGTGGTEAADFEAAEAFFYQPEGYEIYSLSNVFDQRAAHTRSAFFYAEYLNREGCYDSNGNSDVLKALVQLLARWENIRKNTTDPMALTREKADRPVTPQQAVMRTEGTFFPIEDIKLYLSNIKVDEQSFVSSHQVGDLAWVTGSKVQWVQNIAKYPIRVYPLEINQDKEGAIEIYHMPQQGEIPWFRYIAGMDPYDDDHSTTNSLGSMFVMDTITDRIVAEYTGRPMRAVDFYETCEKLLEFYNATVLYENDKKGFYGYMYNRHKLHRLADNPKILRNLDMAKAVNYGNKSKGCGSGKHVNAFGRRLLADYMTSLKPKGDGEQLLNLHTIRSIALLQEALKWNMDGNFDRISAAGMLMIYREEVKQYVLHIRDEDTTDPLAGIDPFFVKNVSSFRAKHNFNEIKT
jgi:hypothetical protein